MKKIVLWVFLFLTIVVLTGCKGESLDYLKENTTFDSENTLLYTIYDPHAELSGKQGGFTDGEYYYQAFIKKDTASDEENNIVRIVKTDFRTGEVIKVSGNLSLNHANDITMNTKTNQLIVVHNNPNRTRLSIVDPETLEITDTKTIKKKIYCIDYNEKRDCYVIGLSGGQTFAIMDSEFNEISEPFSPTERTTGFVTQGVACDDDFIYFVLYYENVITVYDWSGNFITLINLNGIDASVVEPENISIADGEIYVGCSANGGLQVYHTKPYAGTK